MHIVVDLMGSESSFETLYSGVLTAAEKLGCRITVVGTQKAQSLYKESDPVEFVLAKEEVFVDESPLLAVRRKQNSSMAIGIKMLRDKECDAFVSAGNTGAITAYSSLHLSKLAGISRPALMAELPTEKGSAVILDVGANVTFRPESFYKYALMGAAYQKVKRGVQSPRIGLLNIGVEVRKGTRKIRAAFDYFHQRRELLEKKGLTFEGNVESRDLFLGEIEVLVTDGFTGNVFLKTCEGVSSFILEVLRKELSQKPQEELESLKKYLDYREYPGAMLIGVQGVVIKCHGSSTAVAMHNGILGAHEAVSDNLISQINNHLNGYQKISD